MNPKRQTTSGRRAHIHGLTAFAAGLLALSTVEQLPDPFFGEFHGGASQLRPEVRRMFEWAHQMAVQAQSPVPDSFWRGHLQWSATNLAGGWGFPGGCRGAEWALVQLAGENLQQRRQASGKSQCGRNGGPDSCDLRAVGSALGSGIPCREAISQFPQRPVPAHHPDAQPNDCREHPLAYGGHLRPEV